MKIELDNGKYTYVSYGDGRQEALRYGEPWRSLTGDKFVLAMAQRIAELKTLLQEAQRHVTDKPRDDTMRLHARITEALK